MEGLRLRVKDIDFSGKNIIIRDAKGQQDRITMLPQQLIEPLKQQLNYVKSLHDLDLGEGLGEVELPYALARKYPYAARIGEWHYVFLSKYLELNYCIYFILLDLICQDVYLLEYLCLGVAQKRQDDLF